MHSLLLPSSTAIRRHRHRHALQFEQQAIADVVAPGASVFAVALQYDINANLLRRWIDKHLTDVPAANLTPASFAYPALPTTPGATFAAACVRIELQHGDTTITLTWPVEAASQCAPLSRKLLP